MSIPSCCCVYVIYTVFPTLWYQSSLVEETGKENLLGMVQRQSNARLHQGARICSGARHASAVGEGCLCCTRHLLSCPDLVAFMFRISAAGGQALFQRNAEFGDRDAISCDFHCMLSVAVSGLCQQRKYVSVEMGNVSPTCLEGKQPERQLYKS